MITRNSVIVICTPWTVVFRSLLMSLIITLMFEPAKLQMNCASASGSTSRRAARAVAACAEARRGAGRARGFEGCAVWGFSGGAPPAPACAALLPDLVTAAASIGSLAPPDAPGLDRLETMVGENRKDLELLRCDRQLWEQSARSDREEMLGITAADLAEAWSAGISPGDGRLLHAPFG